MRIIAGRFRGRALAAPSGRETRPTSGLARGALFEILRGELEDARVADLFAGTGALGLEALSRGASWIDFYEYDRRALVALRKNIESLGVAERTRVIAGRLPEVLGEGEPYDVVLMDPPWRRGFESRVAARLVERRRLSPNGVLVIEIPRGQSLPEIDDGSLGLAPTDQRRYGDTELRFARLVGSG